MLFPIDRLQFIDNTLIAYEFIDISDKRLNKDGNNHKFMRFKIDYLSEIFKDNFYLIQYNIDKDIYCIGKQHIKMNKDEFKEWFTKKIIAQMFMGHQ